MTIYAKREGISRRIKWASRSMLLGGLPLEIFIRFNIKEAVNDLSEVRVPSGKGGSKIQAVMG